MNDSGVMMVTVDFEADWGSGLTRGIDLCLPEMLAIFDEFGVNATFFVVGELVRRYAGLLRDIAGSHEVGCHSMNHVDLPVLKGEEKRRQVVKSKKALAEIGIEALGFRAPYFHIDTDTLKEIQRAGYLYDSSLASFSDRAGYAGFLSRKYPIKTARGVVRVPIGDILPFRIPYGLSYLRLFSPIAGMLPVSRPKVFYLHPYELLDEERGYGYSSWLKPFFMRNRGRPAREILWEVLADHSRNGGTFMSIETYLKKNGYLE